MGFNLISHLLLFLPLLSVTILSGSEQAFASDNTLLVNTNSTADGGLSSLRGKKQRSGCNLFQGRWVFDASYPFYDSSTCPFIDGEFDCIKFGRPDKQFLKYSWQPESCTIPRFDGAAFLRRWRGKRVMFVGDSLSLNMWESLGCMIHASVPNAKTTFLKRTPLSTITFQEHGVTLYLYRTPYIVDISKEKVGRVLNLGAIEGGANAWKNMDVLVFNSWHWWTHKGQSQGWDYIRDGSSLVKDMNRLDAFYKGLSTWGRWVDQNVDTTKTKVFFQGISPTHYEMSGISSNASAGSSGSSSSRPRYGRIVGVPLKCWCDEQTVGLISKSENNPYRRYFRCGYAASKKLVNDNHIFKWVDEALSNEIETLKFKNSRLEQEMKEMKEMTERIMATDNKAFGTIQKELEKEIFDRFEVEMHEARCGMKKMMAMVVVVVCLTMVVIKLLVA